MSKAEEYKVIERCNSSSYLNIPLLGFVRRLGSYAWTFQTLNKILSVSLSLSLSLKRMFNHPYLGGPSHLYIFPYYILALHLSPPPPPRSFLFSTGFFHCWVGEVFGADTLLRVGFCKIFHVLILFGPQTSHRSNVISIINYCV